MKQRHEPGQSLEGTSLLYFRSWMSWGVAEAQSQDWDSKPGPIPPHQGEVGHQVSGPAVEQGLQRVNDNVIEGTVIVSGQWPNSQECRGQSNQMGATQYRLCSGKRIQVLKELLLLRKSQSAQDGLKNRVCPLLPCRFVSLLPPLIHPTLATLSSVLLTQARPAPAL